MNKIILTIAKIVLVGYILICCLLYFFQEKVIFHPEKLAPNFKFRFDQRFEELNFKTTGDVTLNGLLFKSDSSKGLVFYLHGNAGSLNSWASVAKTYTDLNYDVFMPDYRGYGKSGGRISDEEVLFDDMQLLYSEIRKRYPEEMIIVLGYSIGSAMAAKLAAENKPRLLILQAPYYSLTDMMQRRYPFVPPFLLKYKFETSRFTMKCKMPVIIFHGDKDEIIPYNSSIKLSELFKRTDTLISLKGQGHNGITNNPVYKMNIREILSGYEH